MPPLKLFMLLLGSRPPGRHIEQHDVFFGIANTIKELLPEIISFWSHSNKIHVDAWREVNFVDGYQISILPKTGGTPESGPKLFFINLGGYQENKFEEQHYIVLTVKENRNAAFAQAKSSLFFRENHIPGANSHIDDRYGIDVDDLYEIDEMLPAGAKEKYQIRLAPAAEPAIDEIHLGYFPLNSF